MVSAWIDVGERKRAEEERAHLQQQVIDAQKQAIRDLSSPVIPVLNGIIVMPLIGSIDTARARDVTRALLGGITHHQARVAIIDITGVPIVDSGVADYLNKTIQAARLKGTHTIVTGISGPVAEAIIDLGIDWSDIETVRDLQTGLISALRKTGTRLGI
jgi:rsbT co-antagonist protein RsbR